MQFGGWHRCSLIDFPGKISTIVFTEGCTFRCPFCHNPGLVLPPFHSNSSFSEEEILSFLEKRKGRLEGIVISGGEPTIHKDLENFLSRVKALDYAIKLDTNGSRPEVLETIIKKGLVDYIAMDIKASIPLYEKMSGVPFDTSSLQKSISLIVNSSLNYEFRTTLIKEFHPLDEVERMALLIEGAKKYILQRFRPDVTLDENFKGTSYSEKEMQLLCDHVKPFVKQVEWR